MVTSAPKERQTLANSTPITPPPRMIAEAGTWSSRSAWSEVITRVPSISSPGSERGTEPVASTTCLPVYRTPAASTVVAEESRPSASM